MATVEETRIPELKPRALWFNRDYMLLWSGQTVSSVGTNVSGIAFPLLILAITHNAAIAGFAGALRALPYLFISLPVGALIDRWNRKLIMILCDTGRAIALGSIAVSLIMGTLTIWQIYLVSLVEGTLFVFFDIAEVACLPHVVPKSQLPQATGQNTATGGISALVGPPLGGLLIGISNIFPFAVDAISYIASVFSLFFIKVDFQNERTAEKHNLWLEIGEGLRWLWSNPLIRYMAFLTGSLNFVFAGYFLVLIVIAQDQHATDFQIGLISSIAAIGGIIGSIIGGSIQKRFAFGQVIIVTTWLQTLTIPLVLIAPNFIFLGIFSGITFMMGPIYNVVQFSYRISLIPDELQGRVNSTFRLLAYGFMPLGSAVTGLGLRYLGAIQTVGIVAGILLIVTIITTLTPLIRNARPITAV